MWAAIAVLITRIYLNLCQVANGNAKEEEESFFAGEMVTFAEGGKTLPRHTQPHTLSNHFIGVDVSTSLVTTTTRSTDNTDRV